jgi:CheY-like chemotaxis protein
MAKTEKREKILIVDDQEPMRLLLAQLLEKDLGAEVTLAGTCEAALRLIAESTYDLVLLDVLMPGVGGIEVLRRIRTDSANRATPVILVSILARPDAGSQQITLERAKSLGANGLLAKPVERKGLVAAAKAYLRAAD